jgi:hypothetical protein
MNNILNGRRPGLRTALEIQRQTGGTIKAARLLGLRDA